ncbi:ATP-binding cassette sub-family C member 4-like isoform X2 [Babylonia areolata]|uniref:ATP-binding cassette sub-family C member 4-like isoform X2 n=1 Tax=Babylonia areolata TaxID=304850 RepID=UPI003FD373F8
MWWSDDMMWTGRIFWKGYHHTLDEADVYDVLPQDSTVQLSNNLGREWEKELYRWKTGGSPSLFRAMWRCYRPQIIAFSLLVFLEECLRVVQAVLMGFFIRMFEKSSLLPSPESSSSSSSSSFASRPLRVPDVYLFGGAICLVFLISIFIDHNFFHHGHRMRVAATSLIYRKVMRLTSATLSPRQMEEIMNLVTREMDIFPMVVLPATYIVIGPLQLTVVCYLLWDWLELGPMTLAGVVVLLLLFPLQVFMGKLSHVLRHKTEQLSGQRMRKLQQLFSGLEELKMCCWEAMCEKIIRVAREQEQQQQHRLCTLQSFNSALTLTAGKLVLFVTVMMALAFGYPLSAAQVFTAMMLLETLRVSLSILLPSGLLYIKDLLATVSRVQRVLLLEEKSSVTCQVGCQQLQDNLAVRFVSYYASRDKGTEAPMVLVNIDLDIEKNKLYAVVGPPRGGKSCLLLAIIGELERQKGHLFHHGHIGFVPAVPWLCPGTIRDNIVFGAEFCQTRYNQVLYACSLTQVVDAYPQGDLTVVGERGLTLDNSTQAKITLARAVYQNTDIYLIDDIFSGMDAKSAMHIFKRCITGLLRSKTRLVVTDNSHHARVAHFVVLMSQCRVHSAGSYRELQEEGLDVTTFLNSRTYKNVDLSRLSDLTAPLIQDLTGSTSLLLTGTPPASPLGLKDTPSGSYEMFHHHDVKDSGDPMVSSDSDTSFNSTTVTTTTTAAATAATSSISARCYNTYFILGGGVLGIVLFVLLSVLQQGGFVLSEWWLAYWSENFQTVNHTQQADTDTDTALGPVSEDRLDERIYAYLGLVVVAVVMGFLQAAFFFHLAGRAGAVLHHLALHSLLHAPLAFFRVHSPGAVLSRFVRDVGIVDSLPPIFLDCLQSFSLLLATVVIIGAVNYWLFIVIVPLSIAFLVARHRFHESTQDVERIELSSKSAVGAHIMSSLEGVSTLRAFGVEQRFLHAFDVQQDRSTAACYLHLAADRWFGMRVDLLGLALVLGSTMGSVLMVQYQGMSLPASLVGLSLYYAIHLLNVQQPALRKSAAVHFKMGSVDQLLQCYQLCPELDVSSEAEVRPPPAWPQYGIITFEGVSTNTTTGATGAHKGSNVLRNMWCCIRAQEKMGVMFKSAAEQRLFLSMLLRMTDYKGFIRIDGIELHGIGFQRLREKIFVIPQDPRLFLGTVRQNLDPVSRFTDAQIWRVLDEVHLTSVVQSLPDKLYTDLSTVAEGLSTGHRQLLRLVRALLIRPKILIYEEPLASLDIMCNTIIQVVLKTRFEHSTLLHFAHLPDTVIDSDRVMVIWDGKIQEVEAPHLLLQNPSSKFHRLVEELGLTEVSRLRHVAREKYENKPYVAPPIDPEDFENNQPPRGDLRGPGDLGTLPTFHSARLVGVLNQLPTNKFSTNRL